MANIEALVFFLSQDFSGMAYLRVSLSGGVQRRSELGFQAGRPESVPGFFLLDEAISTRPSSV